MRGVLAAIVVASGCSHSTAPTPAVPQDEDPAADPLAFLPADSELVLEIRLRVLEASQSWRADGPAITSALQRALSSRAWADCVWGQIGPLDRATVAIKGARTIGVLRTSNGSDTMACLQEKVAADGAKVVNDRGEGHLETASVDASNQLAATLRAQVVPAKELFDEIKISAEGPVVTIDAKATRVDTLLMVLLP
jgi:hypothetical protein